MNVRMNNRLLIAVLTLALMVLVACTAPQLGADGAASPDTLSGVLTLPELSVTSLAEGERLRVVATTSIIGDVVRQVAGPDVDLAVLIAPGQDPHSYEPSASDLTKVSEAHVVFVNGWGLEEGLVDKVENALESGVAVPISAGIEPIRAGGHAHEEEEEEEHAEPGRADPHVWFDTRNVAAWAVNVASVLGALQPSSSSAFEDNAAAYQAELTALDAELRGRLAAIPAERRKLVTNHDTFRYFAAAYDFEVIGTILPGASTGAEQSAADLAALLETLETEGIDAVFVENVAGAGGADVLTEETGVQVYSLYTDALGPAGSGADSYAGMMRANVETILSALAP